MSKENLRTQVRTYISKIKEPFFSYRAEVLAMSFVCDRDPDYCKCIPEEAAWNVAGRAYYNRVLNIMYELSTEYAYDDLFDEDDVDTADPFSSLDDSCFDDPDNYEDS